MENIETDSLIIGSSLFAISLGISLAALGKDVLIFECVEEHSIRGFYKIGKTKLNKAPIDGYDFENISIHHLNKSGIKLRKGITIIDNVSYNKPNSTFIVTGFDFKLKANEIICAPNIISLRGEVPLTMDKLETLQWSACAWSDAPFFENQKTGVLGNGSWSANHALNANKAKNEVTIYNPDKVFIADDYLLEELKKHKIRIINNCKKFNLISGKEQTLKYIEYESEGVKFKDECKIMFEGRVTNLPEKYFEHFPKVDKFSFHKMDSLKFEHEKQFELGVRK